MAKMPKRTLKALKGSIAKWEDIVAGTGVDRGTGNCPLCALFLWGNGGMCEKCPVAQKTGRRGCENTPYDRWSDEAPLGIADTPKRRRLAQAELDFLRSLLPEGE